MNNLQPLKWVDHTANDYIDHRAQGAGVSYRVCYFDDKFRVYWADLMGGSDGNKEFDSLDELKHWVDTDHYPRKMQPYVKPMPTWIDVNERLPDKSGRYMIVHQTIKPVRSKSTPVDIDTYDENEKAWTFFRSGIMQEVTHWMPLPEFKESDCEARHKNAG